TSPSPGAVAAAGAGCAKAGIAISAAPRPSPIEMTRGFMAVLLGLPDNDDATACCQREQNCDDHQGRRDEQHPARGGELGDRPSERASADQAGPALARLLELRHRRDVALAVDLELLRSTGVELSDHRRK